MEPRGAAGGTPLKPTPEIHLTDTDLLMGVLLTTFPLTTAQELGYIYRNYRFPMEHQKPSAMAFAEEDPAEHDAAPEGLTEDEELFEINLEAVNSIPPPHYWDSYFTATGNALLANCLLPISEISGAIPIVSEDVSGAVPAGSKSCDAPSFSGAVDLVVIAQPMPLSELLRLPFLASSRVHRSQMKA